MSEDEVGAIARYALLLGYFGDEVNPEVLNAVEQYKDNQEVWKRMLGVTLWFKLLQENYPRTNPLERTFHMALKTLSAPAKTAFQSAGCTLTPAQEHVAATAEASGFDWAGLLGKLASLAVKIIPIILGEFASQQTPKAAAPGCCDHHCLCCETLKSAIHTVELAAKHCCECCCG